MLAQMRACITLALMMIACSGEVESTPGRAGGAGGASGGKGGSTGATGGVSGGTGGTGATGGTTGGAAGSGGSSGSCNVTAPTLARVGTTFDIPSLDTTAPKRNPDIAHDDAHDVFLVVTGATAISGTFLDPDGKSLGTPFAVASTSAYTQTPRVTYGGGKFLVAWHDARNDPNKPELFAKLLSWNGSAPDLSLPDFSVSNGGQSYQEMGAALSYSDTSKLFLVVWQAEPGDDLRGRRIDSSGSLVGDEIQITADPDWQSGAALAWNSTTDEFLVTYAFAGASGAAVHAQRIRAADGSLVGSAIELGTAAGTWTTQVNYLACEDRYFAGWVGSGAVGQRVSSSGTLDGAPFAFPSGYGYPDGFAVAHHPAINTFVAVMHGPTDEDFAAAFVSSGEQSAILAATDNPGSDGHFNPRIAANPARSEWMMVTSLGFTTLVGQRLGP